jgi:hypothetical protein
MITDLTTLADQSVEDVFAIEPAHAEAMQLELLQRRFEELRPRIAVVDTLAADLGVTAISALEDIVPLCLPHTLYKSYAASFVERGRYDRLTEWLAALTTEDLSAIDTRGCDSLEGWLDTVEAGSLLRPLVSSGTTGKVSFFPRSTIEQDQFFKFMMQALGGYREELDSGLTDGRLDFFTTVPMASGRQNLPRMFGLFRDRCFGGDASRIHTLGNGHWSADMLWLSGRLRAAQARGELAEIELTPAHELIRDRIVAETAVLEPRREAFMDELFLTRRDEPVILFAPLGMLIDLAQRCKDRHFDDGLAPGSFILTGGGTKGQAFPTGWQTLLNGTFPPPWQQLYGMTETTATCRLCADGYFHWPATVLTFVVDPDTGVPLPRTGTTSGRLALFDLAPQTHWGGAITGDRVTVEWDAHCGCGRIGARVRDDIVRFTELRDDDKITCAKSPGAYERAVEDLLQL